MRNRTHIWRHWEHGSGSGWKKDESGEIHSFIYADNANIYGKVISYNRTAGEKLWLQKRLLVRALKILISISRHLHLSLLLISAAGYLC